MLTVSEIKTICSKYDILPSKSRGQNFLIDQGVVDKIILAANLKSSDVILEVGPGLGVLTGELIKKAKQVLAIELDRRIISFLKAEFAENNNLEIIEGDILKFNLAILPIKDGAYKIVSNLPYNITSHFLRIFLGLGDKRPSEMVIMIQKEVGERLTAKPGEMSLLSLMVQFYSNPEILFKISKDSFWPAPKVDSVVVRLKLKPKRQNIDPKEFFRLARVGFSARRKQLHNNFAAGLAIPNETVKGILKRMGFDEKARAQDLGAEDWIKLYKNFQLSI